MIALLTASAPDVSLRLQCACTLLVAVGAAYVSYRHGHQFALRYGADKTTAALWPLVVDGLLLTATIELWKTHDHGAASQWKAWLSFMIGIALSLCANIASAPELNIFALAVAACPPLALLLSVELLNQALKRHHIGQAPAPDESPQTNTQQNQVEPVVTAGKAPAPNTAGNNMPGHHARSSPVLDPPRPAQDDPLREEAYRLDAQHRTLHQRPISADNLRQQLGIGYAAPAHSPTTSASTTSCTLSQPRPSSDQDGGRRAAHRTGWRSAWPHAREKTGSQTAAVRATGRWDVRVQPDHPSGVPPFHVRAATAFVSPALEIVDSRIAG
ncbi:DUF2637 domain-containing protein [Saccharopolyspora shandongensis]|uniref:DUF2637 domain-containing protein n=1 Tax=Saccharopolyspora shandongensis TaxID=418495 RepID=UPI003F4D26C9